LTGIGRLEIYSMIVPRVILGAFAALALTFAAGVAEAARPITVFAAASLKNALDVVAIAYRSSTGAQVRVSYAASSAIARQIEAGAPADVFISADADWMDALAKKGLIVAASRRNLLTNHLALIAPVGSTERLAIRKGMPLAAALGPGGRLAIAGPDVPAGRYGEASLKSLGVWPSVENKLARAENVRATLAFVARGETPLGIVYDTDAKIEPKVRIVGLFPDASHPPIVYPAAVVAGAEGRGGADFLNYLQGGRAGAIFRRFGFAVIPKGEPVIDRREFSTRAGPGRKHRG
jgi:molybdate transport system substrate-binding protein